MDLTSYIAKLRTRAGVGDTDGLWTDAACTTLINAALHHVETQGDWRWSETAGPIVAGGGIIDYPVPAGWRRTLGVFDPNGFPLRQVDADQARMLAGATGYATQFEVYGGNVRLLPAPAGSATFTHLYLTTEVDLALPADEPLLPDLWAQAAIEYATYLGHQRWGNLQEAGAANAAYVTWIERMRAAGNAYSPEPGGGELAPPPAPPK